MSDQEVLATGVGKCSQRDTTIAEHQTLKRLAGRVDLIAIHYRPSRISASRHRRSSMLFSYPLVASMPRYFFNVHFDHHVARDPIGVEVADLVEAVNQARKARTEIMHEDELARLWLEIVDERGLVLARVGA
jgi:hypothetical protein